MDDRQRYRLKINEAPDRAALRAIVEELANHSDPNMRAMRLIAGQRSAALRPRAGEDFAAAYGVTAPTGAPLYRYRIDNVAFERLGADLARCSGYPALEQGTMPALFVLWAAEWFRRHHQGGGHRWPDLVAALGIGEGQDQLRRLARLGLACSRRQRARRLGDRRSMQRHRHQEFIRFLNAVEAVLLQDKSVHVILDHYVTHKQPKVRAWLDRHPR